MKGSLSDRRKILTNENNNQQKNEKFIGNINYMWKYIHFLTTKMSWDEVKHYVGLLTQLCIINIL